MKKKEGYEKGSRTIKYMFVWILLTIILGLNPYNRVAWFLDFIIIFGFAMFFILIRKKFEFSNVSLILITILIFLNLYGYNWGFGNVPLFLGLDTFGVERNPYDKFMHFLFGVLAFYPLTEILSKKIKVNKNAMLFICFSVIMGLGAIYEIIEYILAQLLSPEINKVYLATLGDEWDTQKDMFVMGIGAVLYISARYIYNLKIKFKKIRN